MTFRQIPFRICLFRSSTEKLYARTSSVANSTVSLKFLDGYSDCMGSHGRPSRLSIMCLLMRPIWSRFFFSSFSLSPSRPPGVRPCLLNMWLSPWASIRSNHYSGLPNRQHWIVKDYENDTEVAIWLYWNINVTFSKMTIIARTWAVVSTLYYCIYTTTGIPAAAADSGQSK